MISLTDNAIAFLKQYMADNKVQESYVRIGAQAGGCAGYQYKVGFESNITPEDHIIDNDGIKVVVDHKSGELLHGTVIDYAKGLNGSGFKFVNPNAKQSCGCGKSFCG